MLRTLNGIECIRGAILFNETATPCCPVGKLAHLRQFTGDDCMLHLPQVVADHAMKSAQHDPNPADIVAEQRSQSRINRTFLIKRKFHCPFLIREKPACHPRRPKGTQASCTG